MNKTIEMINSSDLYTKIAMLPLGAAERAKALAAAELAETLVSSFVRLFGLTAKAKPGPVLGTPKAV
jgi:hypothetical protein